MWTTGILIRARALHAGQDRTEDHVVSWEDIAVGGELVLADAVRSVRARFAVAPTKAPPKKSVTKKSMKKAA